MARGDDTAGALLIVCRERGVLTALLEHILQSGGYAWSRVGPRPTIVNGNTQIELSESQANDWVEQRRGRDPDLWVVELDIAASERFAAETLGEG